MMGSESSGQHEGESAVDGFSPRKQRLSGKVVPVVVPVAVTGLQLSRGFPLCHSLSDGFFVNAVLFLGIAVLRLAGNSGCFDLAGYGLLHTFRLHYPGAGEDEDFHAYRDRKRSHPSPVAGSFLVAVSSLGLAVVMLVLASLG